MEKQTILYLLTYFFKLRNNTSKLSEIKSFYKINFFIKLIIFKLLEVFAYNLKFRIFQVFEIQIFPRLTSLSLYKTQELQVSVTPVSR